MEYEQKSGRERYSGSIGFPAESSELFEVEVDFSFLVELVVAFGTKVNEGRIVFQNVVDSDKHGMCYGNICSLFASASANALELGVKVRTLHLNGRVSANNEGCL